MTRIRRNREAQVPERALRLPISSIAGRPGRRVACPAALILCSSATAIAGTVSLSQLQPGDRIHVSYGSRGCFHDRKCEIDFERGTSVTAHSAGRSVTLSAREIQGLDRLIQFYRSRPVGGCTTEDEITITWFRDRQKIASERYVDRSCATYQMKDVMRFYEIATKLQLERNSSSKPTLSVQKD